MPMFNNLLESKAKKKRSIGWDLTSAGLVSGLIALSAYATAQAAIERDKPREEKIQFAEVKPEEPPPPKEEPPPPPPPKDVVVAPPPPKGFQVLTAPVEIPDVIPEIDLSKKVTDEADFTGKGAAGGTSKGVAGGVPQPANSDQPFFEFQVEKPAQQISGNPPQFPDILRSANVAGQVIAQFVVNEDGKADMSTFKALESDHELFTAAVKRALPSYRFIPAETGGRKVKQLVQLPFQFSLQS
jgi:protein TonB